MNTTTVPASYQVLDVGSAEASLVALKGIVWAHDRLVHDTRLKIESRVRHAKVRDRCLADATAISKALRKKDRSFSRFMKRAMKPVDL